MVRRAEPNRGDDDVGELNVVPFLDIVMNVVMFLLAGLATVFTATIPVPVDRDGPSAESPPPTFTVKIVAEGYIVATPDGYLQPGCARSGPAAVAVPTQLGRYDTEALTTCLLTARMNPAWRSLGGTDGRIQVAVVGAVPYHALVQTLDALRESRPGARDLFPRPRLGLLM